MKRITFVIATKDRPDDLLAMLRSLLEQSHRPDQVVIVDSSAKPVRIVTKEFSSLNIKYIHHARPSASQQRNIGIRSVDSDAELIGFLDDDAVLEHHALENMLKFWQTAPDNLGGCSFNLMNHTPTGQSLLKNSALARLLGLYNSKNGTVMPSGWHTITGTCTDTTFVDWLPSGACVWRKDIFENFCFDEFFDGYSYLEDLDFSYSISRSYKLAILADAGFYHYHSTSGRISSYQFGKIEVKNRLYIVRKHGLSELRCYFGIMIRLTMTLATAAKTKKIDNLQRFFGNCTGIIQSLLPNRN